MKNIFVAVLLALLTFCTPAYSIVNVPNDAPTIQAGIDMAVPGETVRVADGIYSGDGNRDIDFNGKNIHLESENGPGNCTIDCGGSSEDNHCGFIFQSNESDAATVSGFTIQNGYMEYHAAGIECRNGASPAVSNCFIEHNTSEYGAGVQCDDGTAPTFSQCTIRFNTGLTSGGGISVAESDVVFTDCIIENNSAEIGGGVVIGFSGGTPTFHGCTFSENSAAYHGGAMSIGYQSAPVITNCTFTGNTANHYGGAIHVDYYSDPVIGGTEGNGNFFTGNNAGSGMDLGCHYYDSENPYIATWNHFAGHCCSDFYVSSPKAFDLANCTSDTTPIMQDVYVLPGGNDENDGLSWQTAFRTLRHALGSVCGTTSNPVTVHIGPGSYSPSLTGDTFNLPVVNDVIIQGDSAATTVLDAEGISRLFYVHKDNHARIRDITLTGGESVEGGAIFLTDTTLSIERCRILENHVTGNGGGVFLRYSLPVFEECVFSGNIADGNGGGLYNAGECGPEFIDCDISGNTALHGCGGGYFNIMFGWHTFHQCRISNNEAGQCGGGLFMGSKCVTVTMTQSTISENTAKNHGGGFYSGWDVLSDIANSLFIGNTALGSGGAIFISDESPTQILNCTLTGNMATEGGGVFCEMVVILDIIDSIFWNDTPVELDGNLTHTTITYSDIQGGFSGMGNINADPLFCSGPGGSNYLSQEAAGQPMDSPCLNSGSDTSDNICFTSTTGTFCMDEMTTRTDTMPDLGNVDMGFHYNPAATAPPTSTPTASPSNTQVPTDTPTVVPTNTQPPTATSTPEIATPTSLPTKIPTATPTQSDIPTATATPGSSAPDITLHLNRTIFNTGDRFLLSCNVTNPGAEMTVDCYILLDVYGEYWFYPSWSQDMDYDAMTLSANYFQTFALFDFEWPDVDDHASNLKFWAALLKPGLPELISEVDMVEFGY